MIYKKIDFAKTKDVTVLEFGKGDIKVQPASGVDYESLMFKTSKPYPIGTNHKSKGKNSDWFKPEVVMIFPNINSIDVVIERLNIVRKNLVESLK